VTGAPSPAREEGPKEKRPDGVTLKAIELGSVLIPGKEFTRGGGQVQGRTSLNPKPAVINALS